MHEYKLQSQVPKEDAAPGNAGSIASDLDGWQPSQDRVLHYLKALGVPPVQSLQICKETLDRAAAVAARHVDGDSPCHPISLAMELLQQVLEERSPMLATVRGANGHHAPKVAGEADTGCRNGVCFQRVHPAVPPRLTSQPPPSVPPLQRTQMLPDMVQPRLLRNLLAFLLNFAIVGGRAKGTG